MMRCQLLGLFLVVLPFSACDCGGGPFDQTGDGGMDDLPDANVVDCIGQPDGTLCGGPLISECDLQDTCSNEVCVPRLLPEGTPCGDATDSECTAPDLCDAQGACLPNDEPDGMTCDDCTLGAGNCDSCSGGICLDQCTPGGDELVTTYESDSGLDGIMFDIEALQRPLTITGFDLNLYSVGGHDVEVWHRSGSYVGFTESPEGWTMVGSATGLTSNGDNVPTALPLAINVTIPQREIHAFYITSMGTSGINYTIGNSEGSVHSSNNHLRVLEGAGKQWLFGATFGARIFNGTVYYNVCP